MATNKVNKTCSAKKGPNWSEDETRAFLELCIEKQILKLMDTKKFKHVDIFRSLVSDMQKRGFSKTPEQMKLKLKKLKQEYTKCRDDNNKSGASPKRCPFFDELDLLYGLRPRFEPNSSHQGIDTAAGIFDSENSITTQLDELQAELLNDDVSGKYHISLKNNNYQHRPYFIVDNISPEPSMEINADEGTKNPGMNECSTEYISPAALSDEVEETPQVKKRRSNLQGKVIKIYEFFFQQVIVL